MYLRKYWELYKTGVKEASAYRLMSVSSFFSTLIYIVLLLAVWTAISQSADLAGGLSRVISYIVLAQVINSSISMGIEQWFGYKIRQGTIVNELKRPVSLFSQAYLHEVGWQSFDTLLKSVPLLVIGVAFTGLEIPGMYNFAAFLISVVLSFHLMLALALSTSMLVFWTKTDSGVRFTRSTIVSFLSGVVFPLYLLPEGLKEIFYVLPFHLVVDGPINIFLMQTTGSAITDMLLQQLMWIGIFFATSQLLWYKAKKKLTVQGG
ncbi:MAG: ABC transporter permease [Candidatus Nanohaloarchaea archaeon]